MTNENTKSNEQTRKEDEHEPLGCDPDGTADVSSNTDETVPGMSPDDVSRE